MEKSNNFSLWIEVGYDLFAHEGLDGIQVERLSRMLQLNKSGFYHYFGDMAKYCDEIVSLHIMKMDNFLSEVNNIKKLDPDYLQLLVKYAPVVMFQVQLTREKKSYSFYQASEAIEHKVNSAVQRLWSDFLGLHTSHDLALRYYFIVRDAIYSQVSFQNLNYEFLHNLVSEAKQLVTKLVHQQPL